MDCERLKQKERKRASSREKRDLACKENLPGYMHWGEALRKKEKTAESQHSRRRQDWANIQEEKFSPVSILDYPFKDDMEHDEEINLTSTSGSGCNPLHGAAEGIGKNKAIAIAATEGRASRHWIR
ncbi:hypothetical protein SAY87_014458 [Trapa incisa]|uniref:Uncharacterized protein n=1 Tax=Trapa incisa TaxID=236973 RepID=A0AAN7GW61_9MYRT|nr:hypothetical protein SAY87_014458 [Trapa incisa]